jgi:hypothetical protein
MEVRKQTIVLLDWDDAINNAKNRGVITKEEAKVIHDYMRSGVSYVGNHYGLYWGDIEESNGMEENPEPFEKFYGLYKEYEVDDGEFSCIYFDCTAYN